MAVYCDIRRDGTLLENGVDPFYEGPPRFHGSVQCNLDDKSDQQKLLEGIKALVGAKAGIGRDRADDLNLANFALTASPSAQVLRLAVGLLGLEVHEAPKTSAAAWLTYQDAVDSKLGLAGLHTKAAIHGHEGAAAGEDVAAANARNEERLASRRRGRQEQQNWQFRVLSHLRDLVENSTSAADEAAGEPKATSGNSGHDWGPDFHEHLNLADYILSRVTSAVNVLQDPEKSDRPMVLREYTEKMVVEVCRDLRQWLEQMATLFSLYHVHLLDLDNERRRNADLLAKKQAEFDKGEQERQAALARLHVIEEHAKEERMKRRAEELLGLSLSGPDAKIYTEKDKQAFYKKWREEELEPVLAELRELLAQSNKKDRDAMNRIQRQPTGFGATGGRPQSDDWTGMLITCISKLADKTGEDDTRDLLTRLAECVSKGGEGLQELLKDIQIAPSSPTGAKKPAGGDDKVEETKSVPKYRNQLVSLDAVTKELGAVEHALSGTGADFGLDKLAGLIGWAEKTVHSAKETLKKTALAEVTIDWTPAPKWDLSKLTKRSSSKTLGTNTVPVNNEPPPPVVGGGNNDADWQAKLDALRREMEAKLAAAMQKVADLTKERDEALRRLAEEMERAEKAMADLKGKLQDMERRLKADGVGPQAADAIQRSGLSDFMHGRDVFERLYRDALDRMRRLAEAQAKVFEETSIEFFNVMQNIAYTPVLRLGGGQDDEPPKPRPAPMKTFEEILAAARARQASATPDHSVGREALRSGSPLTVVRLGPSSSPPIMPTRVSTAPHRGPEPKEAPSPRPSSSAGRLIKGPPLMSRASPWEGGEIDLTIASGRVLGCGSGAPSAAPRSASGTSPHKELFGQRRSRPEVLPPLECQGRRTGSPDPLHSGADLAAPAKPKRSSQRSRSPPVNRPGRWPLGSRQGGITSDSPGIDDIPLTISSVGTRSGSVGASLLLPPENLIAAPLQPKAASVSAVHKADGKIQRVGRGNASRSMPTLHAPSGPPRLLVQSVGAAY